LIQQSDRTVEEWAEAISQLDPRARISSRHLRRLARAERDTAPTPATRRALSAAFDRSVEDLLGPWAPDHHRLPALDGLVLPSPGTERSALIMAAQRARRFSLLTAEGGTTSEVVDQLSDDVQRLTLAYPQRPLSELLGDLVETQDTLFTLLERRQAPNVARQLHFLTAVASGLLAKASHDLAEPHSAMLQARTAVLCADQADHDGLRAWLRGLQSMVSYWAGRYSESLRYAELGGQFAARTGGTTSVWLPISAARAHAALGNAGGALDAIHQAEDAWEQVRPDEVDALGGICTFSRPRTLYYAADALAWLPEQAAEGRRYSEEAVVAYGDPHDPAWAFGDQAGSHADLAIARIAGEHPDLEGAAAALAAVLDLPADQRINGIIASVRHVHQALTTAGLAGDASDLMEAIEDFTRIPAAALPR
jgi:hypothetical protein